ncbi:hypothetical protein CEXT_421371 [Caerostris extrusa]|uniref:Uncharacterized protein n=1 Tax=Caerostris extrusa TaxID=172846 RepID=A0AAV4W5N6_CAEEX|nr:hypothetical protein CEXT_421371 [Caerostris extrusa]
MPYSMVPWKPPMVSDIITLYRSNMRGHQLQSGHPNFPGKSSRGEKRILFNDDSKTFLKGSEIPTDQ